MKINPGNARGLLVPQGDRPFSFVVYSSEIRDFGMHGFRSTFRDWAAENGIDQVLAEKSLMHATGNEVEQAYQRSDLLEQRRTVMQAWADTIMPKNK